METSNSMAKQAKRNGVPPVKPTELMTDDDWQEDAEWSDEAWLIPSRGGGEASMVIRVQSPELDGIQAAAERAGVSASEWILEAARQRLRRRRTA
jgi:hypothetical protein